MAREIPELTDTETEVTVRYFASARAASGVAEERIAVDGPLSLAALMHRAIALHPGTRLEDVLAVCSTLLDDLPVGARDPGEVTVHPGMVVQFLPPFAGG